MRKEAILDKDTLREILAQAKGNIVFTEGVSSVVKSVNDGIGRIKMGIPAVNTVIEVCGPAGSGKTRILKLLQDLQGYETIPTALLNGADINDPDRTALDTGKQWTSIRGFNYFAFLEQQGDPIPSLIEYVKNDKFSAAIPGFNPRLLLVDDADQTPEELFTGFQTRILSPLIETECVIMVAATRRGLRWNHKLKQGFQPLELKPFTSADTFELIGRGDPEIENFAASLCLTTEGNPGAMLAALGDLT